MFAKCSELWWMLDKWETLSLGVLPSCHWCFSPSHTPSLTCEKPHLLSPDCVALLNSCIQLLTWHPFKFNITRTEPTFMRATISISGNFLLPIPIHADYKFRNLLWLPSLKPTTVMPANPWALPSELPRPSLPTSAQTPWLRLPSSLPSPTTWASTWSLDFLIWSIFKTEWRWFCYNVKTDHVSLLPETFQWFPLPLSESQHLCNSQRPCAVCGSLLPWLSDLLFPDFSLLSLFLYFRYTKLEPISSLLRCQNETGLDLGLEGQKFVYAIWKNAIWRTIFNKIEFKIINRKLGIKVNIYLELVITITQLFFKLKN